MNGTDLFADIVSDTPESPDLFQDIVAEPERPVPEPTSFFQRFAPPGPLQVVAAYQALRGIKPRQIETPGQALEYAYEQAMTPAVTGTAPYIEKGLKYSLGVPQLAMRLIPKQTQEDVRRAVSEGIAEYGVEPLTSPFGIATAGIGAAGGIAGRLAGLGFAALGAQGLGESASRLLESIKARNIAEAIKAGMGVGAQGLMVGAGGKMALRKTPKLRTPPTPEPVVPEPTITEPIPETRPERLLRKPAIEMGAPPQPPRTLTEIEQFLADERMRERQRVIEPEKRATMEEAPIIGEEPQAVEWELILPEKYAMNAERRAIAIERIKKLQGEFADAQKAGDAERMRTIQDEIVQRAREVQQTIHERQQYVDEAGYEGTYPATAEQLGTFKSREFVPELSELTGHAPETEKLPAHLKPPSTPLATADQIREAKRGFIKGSLMDEWAKRVLKEGRVLSGPDPELLAAYAVRGASLIEEGLMNFAQWSARMLKEHGPEIQPFLEGLYRQAQNYYQRSLARKEKYNAIQRETKTVLRDVRPQPGEGAGEVPVSRPVEAPAVRGEPVEAKAGEVAPSEGGRVLGDLVKGPEGEIFPQNQIADLQKQYPNLKVVTLQDSATGKTRTVFDTGTNWTMTNKRKVIVPGTVGGKVARNESAIRPTEKIVSEPTPTEPASAADLITRAKERAIQVSRSPVPKLSPEVVKAVQALPPIPEGYVRWYHGRKGVAGGGLADAYHAKELPGDPLAGVRKALQYGPELSYTDIPRDVSERFEAGRRRGEATITDKEWASQSKPVGTFEQPISAEIPEPTPGIISGSYLERWANTVLAEGRLASFGSPKTIAAIAIKEAAFLEREARSFGSWSARLIKEYGPAIEPHLREIWDRSQNYYERSLAARPKAPMTAQQIENNATVRGNEAARGEKPPGDNPPVTTDASETPSENVTRANKDYQIFNRLNTAQWTFSFGRLGEAAQAAINRIFLGEFRMRESTRRDIKTYVVDLLKSIPRKMRWRGGEAFFDVLDGKTMDQIRAEWTGKEGGEKVIAAAERIKNRLEEIRVTIRDTKRDAFRGYLNSMDKPFLEDLYRRNVSPQLGGPAMTKAQLADALTAHEFPDNWGIADGSYLPHMFFGNWKATVTLPGGTQSGTVIRGKTLAQTKAEIYKLTKDNPAFQNASIKIEQDTVVPADMIRLGDRQFWKHVQKMKDAMGATSSEIREAQAGIIGRRAAKQKWWGALRARVGYKGYSRNFQQVLSSYLSGFHRWKELSAMQRDVMPLVEQVRREGRRNAADRLDGIMENLWGKPARSTVEFDAFVRRIPGLRDWIKPLALDRWSRNVRSIISYAALMTIRFGVINRLQPLQGLYPLVGERLLMKGKILQHTAEGQKLLDEAGVKFDPGQYAPERGIITRASEFMQRVRGEQSNQELAFLSMYLHGVEKGLSKPEAINYAKLRGQLMTQFTPLISDIPQILEGPFGQLMFQFKRFTIKQAELAANMIRDKNVTGLARMLAMFAVLGGTSFYLRQTLRDKRTQLAMKKNFVEHVGDKGADILMYGLPGYIGADISGSLVLGDEPYGADIYSKIGRQFTGPFVSMGIETAKGITTEARKPIAPLQKTMAIMRRIPTLRPIAELQALMSGDLDILTPDGETKYRRAVGDAIAGLGSFRSAHEANKMLSENAIIELEKESKRLKNAYFASGGSDESLQKILDYNERWPEVAITGAEMMRYIRYRHGEATKTKEQKVARKKFRPLLED